MGYKPTGECDIAAKGLGRKTSQMGRVYKDIERERSATLPLHLTALLVSEVPEIIK